jgi:hypothetical protein
MASLPPCFEMPMVLPRVRTDNTKEGNGAMYLGDFKLVSLFVCLLACLSVCPFACLSIFNMSVSVYVCLCVSDLLSVCLSLCLSVCLSVCPSVCLSVWTHPTHSPCWIRHKEAGEGGTGEGVLEYKHINANTTPII